MSRSNDPVGSRATTIFLTGTVAALVGISLSSYTTAPAKVIMLAGLILAFSLGTTAWRMTRYGIGDPLGLFAAFFSGYNGVLLLQVGLELQRDSLVTPYPVIFDVSSFTAAGIDSLLAVIGLLVGGILASLLIPQRKPVVRQGGVAGEFGLWAGILSYLVGVALLFLNYGRIGGFAHSLVLARGERMQLISMTSGGLPYTQFVFAGLALILIRFLAVPKRVTGLIALTALGLWILLLLVQGDRRFILYSLLIFVVVAEPIYFRRIKVSTRLVFATMALYVFFALFAHVRFLAEPLFTGTLSRGDAFRWIQQNASVSWLLPGNNEFAGPYFSLLSVVRNHPAPTLGRSYFQAASNLLPRSFYPGIKPPTLAHAFADQVHENFMASRPVPIGWGYSPVAEARLNFGLAGVPLVFLLYGLVLHYLGVARWRGYLSVVAVALVSPIAFDLNRADFASIVQEGVYQLAVILPLVMMGLSRKQRSKKAPNIRLAMADNNGPLEKS